MSDLSRKDTETIGTKNNNRQEQPVFKQFKNPTKEPGGGLIKTNISSLPNLKFNQHYVFKLH